MGPAITLEGTVVEVTPLDESPHNFGCRIEPTSLMLSEEAKRGYQELTVREEFFKAIPVTICNNDGPVEIKVGDRVRVCSKEAMGQAELGLDCIYVLGNGNGIRYTYRCH